MKKHNKRLIICGIISSVIIITLAIMLISLTLVKTSDRNKTISLTKSQKAKVDSDTKGMNVEQIIDYSLNLTAMQLQFSRYNNIENGKANCVGYAQLCASICNQALRNNGINGHAKPVVGYIKSFGINWCDVLKAIAPLDNYKRFVKDHDFVELLTDSKSYYFDPSIYDVIGKDCLCVN